MNEKIEHGMDHFLLKEVKKTFAGFWLTVALYHVSQITTGELILKIVSYRVGCLKRLKYDV